PLLEIGSAAMHCGKSDRIETAIVAGVPFYIPMHGVHTQALTEINAQPGVQGAVVVTIVVRRDDILFPRIKPVGLQFAATHVEIGLFVAASEGAGELTCAVSASLGIEIALQRVVTSLGAESSGADIDDAAGICPIVEPLRAAQDLYALDAVGEHVLQLWL